MILEVRYRKIQNCYYKSILFVKVFGYTKLLLMTIWRSLGCCISVGLLFGHGAWVLRRIQWGL